MPQYIRRRLSGSLLARCHVYCYMSSDPPHSLVVVPICRDTYMLLPSKMEGGGDQLARTLSVCLVWGIGGVALGHDRVAISSHASEKTMSTRRGELEEE